MMLEGPGRQEEESPVRYLFIGGAPRSGTTLLANMLDGHAEMLVFPMEHSTFERYLGVPSSRHRSYFSREFVERRSEGQQSVLADRRLYGEYRERMKEEYGVEFIMDIDAEAFLTRYRSTLEDGEATLERVFRALARGLTASNEFAAAVGPAAVYAAFKRPYFTELWAEEVASRMPTARFIHVIRDPRARYASAKKRRLRTGPFGRTASRRINQEDFVTGHAQVSVSSLHYGLKNRHSLGVDRYLIVRYEDLVGAPEETIGKVAHWLGVRVEPALLTPTRLNVPAASGSKFEVVTSIDSGAADRRDEYEELTSPTERRIHHAYLEHSDYPDCYDLPRDGRQPGLLRWAYPFRHERVRDYLWRLVTGKARLDAAPEELEWKLREQLPAVARRGRAEVNGAT